MESLSFDKLVEYLQRVPAIKGEIGPGGLEPTGWWVKFTIDVGHPLAWSTVQQLGHVLNYISVDDR